MLESDKYDLIEKYLNKNMSGEEMLQFEQKLSNDNSLKEEVELHRQASEVLKGNDIHDFRNTLKAVDNKWEHKNIDVKKRKIISLSLKRTLAIAASIALFVIAWQFLISPNSNRSETYFFTEHFEPYQMVLNQRTNNEGTAVDALLNSAIQQYSAGQFVEAAKSFKQLKEEEPNNIAFSFYQAVSLLSYGKTEESIRVFENILSKKNHLYTEQSRWYLSMAYLRTKQKKKATLVLEKIKEGEYKFDEKEKLLESLRHK